MLLTTVLFTLSLAWSALREVDRPRYYYFHFGLAESAVLGAFLAQDLILFVAFFDLMLIPFYFLVGSWGTGERVRATIKMVIYTAVGSFLMLAAAMATGVLASNDHGTAINFTFSTLQHLPLSRTDEDWIFLGFAAAFLVKMPIAPFHGWLADAYKSMPIPAVAVFSGVVAKVASYGFLQIVLPLFPHASHHFQMLMLIIALVSIMWATAIAFTTRDARLVIAYSSVAQMGFIMLGIFSLRADGGQGALLQMINHGVVTAASFFIVAAVAARAGGSENLDDMGGEAFRAPVLATMFLIVTLANLAMPGSSNFIGEFMILLGAFNSHMADRDHRLGRGGRCRLLRAAAVHRRDAQPRRSWRRFAGDRARRGDRDRAPGPDHPGAGLLPAVRAQQVRGFDEGRALSGGGGRQHRPLCPQAGRRLDRAAPVATAE